MLRDFRPDVLNTEERLSLASTSPSALPVNQKRVLFLLKKALRLSWSDSETQTCQLKKISPTVEVTLERDITVIPQKISFLHGIGPVRHGRVTFVADKSLHELEIEFTEWKTQQKHIVDRVDQLHTDMSDVKKAVFQAKWMLVGALVFAGMMNSEAFMELILNLGAK